MAVVASPEQMYEAANKLDGTIERINSILDSMKTHVGNVGDNWTDEAGKSFNESWDELKASMPEYINKVHATATFMKRMADAYRKAVEVNAKAVNQEDVEA